MKAPLVSLKEIIQKNIINRIVFTMIIIFIIPLSQATFNVIEDSKKIQREVKKICASLENFTIGQSLVGNDLGAEMNLSSFNNSHRDIKVQWIKVPSNTNHFQWNFPFDWTYDYHLRDIGENHFGYFHVTGRISFSRSELYDFFIQFFMLILFSLSILILLYPIAKKIPNKLILLPINQLLTLLDDKKPHFFDEYKSQTNILELKEIEDKIVELLKKTNERSKKEAICEISAQVAHDIRSPLVAILMMTESCSDIQESTRVCLREAAERIQDITHLLLIKPDEEGENQHFKLYPVLVASTILSVLSAKRAEYHKALTTFLFEAKGDPYFSFILANTIEFKRMLSNIINNAVEAMANDTGHVLVSLRKEKAELVIAITDSGCGMSCEQINTILVDEKIETKKKHGQGIGLTHARDMLKRFDAKLAIYSNINQGSTVELWFKSIDPPMWIADEIIIKKQDCMVILDDDHSIHAAWDEIFSLMVAEYPGIKLQHFTNAEECMAYIHRHSQENFLLLSDYEFIGQPYNGLDVIERVDAARAILVTSHSENKDIIKRAMLHNVKILPKMLAYHVKLTIDDKTQQTALSQTDLVLLEDNKEFSSVLDYLYKRSGRKITVYHTPYALFRELALYPKHTKICLDYDLACPVTGIDVAEVLYQKGYEHLYLATGFQFDQKNLPSYLHLLESKMAIKDL